MGTDAILNILMAGGCVELSDGNSFGSSVLVQMANAARSSGGHLTFPGGSLGSEVLVQIALAGRAHVTIRL